MVHIGPLKKSCCQLGLSSKNTANFFVHGTSLGFHCCQTPGKIMQIKLMMYRKQTVLQLQSKGASIRGKRSHNNSIKITERPHHHFAQLSWLMKHCIPSLQRILSPWEVPSPQHLAELDLDPDSCCQNTQSSSKGP